MTALKTGSPLGPPPYPLGIPHTSDTSSLNHEVLHNIYQDVGRQRGPRTQTSSVSGSSKGLWKLCQRGENFRRDCWRARPWERHKHMFGDTEEDQNRRKTQETREWFDFIQSSNIVCHTNVKEDWDRPETSLPSVMWC